MHGSSSQQGGWHNAQPDASRAGEITLISGCMFSGKTTRLLEELTAYPPDGALAFKPIVDDRYRADAIVSHDGATFRAAAIEQASDILQHVRLTGVRMIAIDEVHFLDDSMVEVVIQLSRGGISVFLAGLDFDSWGRPFPHMVRLASLATSVVTRQGRCARCGQPATRTQRTRPIVGGRLVGGAESYEPRCQPCWTPPPVDRYVWHRHLAGG